MAVSLDPRPASLDEQEHEHDDGAERGSASRWPGRRGLVVALIVVIAVALGALAWAVTERYDGDPAALVQADSGLQADRDQAMKQARAFMLRMNTYGPDDLAEGGSKMPGYRREVSALVTDKFGADFETKGVPLAEATVAQQGLQRTAEVYSTGVQRLDEDSATALVAGSFTNSYPKKPGAKARVSQDPLPFRVTVDLVKSDGSWLVDSFAPVGEKQQGASGEQGATQGGVQ